VTDRAGPSDEPESPVLIVNGWEVFHGGLTWRNDRNSHESNVKATLHLAVRPPKSLMNHGMSVEGPLQTPGVTPGVLRLTGFRAQV
jgi:hypothetical protein